MRSDFQQWVLLPVRWGSSFLINGPRIWWRLFTDSKTSAISTIFVQTISVVFTAVIARWLGSVEYGKSTALATYVNLFTLIYSYPLMALIAKFIAEGKQQNKPFERKCAMSFWLYLLAGLIAASLSILFLPWGLSFYNLQGLHLPGILYALTYISSTPIAFCLFLLQAMGRVKLWSFLNIINAVSALIVTAIIISFTNTLTLLRYFEIIIITNIAAGIFSFLLILKLLGYRNIFSPDFKVTKEIIKAGFGGWIAILCAYTAIFGVSTMVAKFADNTRLGYYQIITNIGTWVYNVIISVTIPALSTWSKLAAEKYYTSLRRNFRLCQFATTSLAVIAAIVTFIFAPEILTALYGQEYRTNYWLLRINTIAWIMLGFGGWYWIFFSSIGKPWLVMMPNVVWGTLQITTCYCLMKLFNYDIYGAMIAHALSYICWAITYEVVFERTCKTLSSFHPPAGEEVAK